jgi:hypothetical protein
MSLLSGPVDKTSRSEVKIALFRSLFRGRDDVYPRRSQGDMANRDRRAIPTTRRPWASTS